MASKIVHDLQAFAVRLKGDGFPSALVEQAARRMKAMEELIVSMQETAKSLEQGDERMYQAYEHEEDSHG